MDSAVRSRWAAHGPCARRPAIVSRRIADGCSLVLPPQSGARAEQPLILILGGGRGCVLRCDDALAGIWLPLRGRLQFGGGNTEGVLVAGEMRVTEPESNLNVSGRGSALWIAVLGAGAAWRNALAGFSDVPVAEPPLLPATHAADRRLRRDAVALARAFASGAAHVTVEALLDNVVDLQAHWAAAIERCPGRTYMQRRQVFLRLQRVRNYLAAHCHLDFDNDELARMASYSPWHFIRAFRAAYQQTPHAYLIEQRLCRARRLLRSSSLAISEVALASGFENRCAFSRLFRQRFGTTAGALRSRSLLAAEAS